MGCEIKVGCYSVAAALRSNSSSRSAQYVQNRWPGGPAKTLVRPQFGQVSLASASTAVSGRSTSVSASTGSATAAASVTATGSLGVGSAAAAGGISGGGATAGAVSASSCCPNSRV